MVRGGGGCRAREMAVVAGSARGMQGGPKPDDDDNISLFLVVGLLTLHTPYYHLVV
jgi:hypothetical protein